MLRRFINGLADIIYPRLCLACKNKLGAQAVCASVSSGTDGKRLQTIENFICVKCRGSIKRNVPPFCNSCGRHLEKSSFSKNLCPSCLKRRLHFDRAFSPYVYTGVIKELIHEFKYKNKDYLGFAFSDLMIEFIKEYNLPMDCLDFIIPMPLHGARLREREFNQAEVLSKYVAEGFNKKVLSSVLRKHHYTSSQTDLEVNERLSNVKGSFSVRQEKDIKTKNLLLIDDVLTTGATSSEAALALKDAGANIVFVLTLAN